MAAGIITLKFMEKKARSLFRKRVMGWNPKTFDAGVLDIIKEVVPSDDYSLRKLAWENERLFTTAPQPDHLPASKNGKAQAFSPLQLVQVNLNAHIRAEIEDEAIVLRNALNPDKPQVRKG